MNRDLIIGRDVPETRRQHVLRKKTGLVEIAVVVFSTNY